MPATDIPCLLQRDHQHYSEFFFFLQILFGLPIGFNVSSETEPCIFMWGAHFPTHPGLLIIPIFVLIACCQAFSNMIHLVAEETCIGQRYAATFITCKLLGQSFPLS